MADGHFPTLVSKDRLPNSASNTIFVSLTDGTDTVLIDGSGNLQVIAAANDGVDIGDVTVNNAAGASAVNIQDGGNSITVDGTVSIAGTVTVTATNLDIRDLTHVSDSVKIGDGTDLLAVNADGSINVVATVTNPSVKVDDTAFTVATDSLTVIGGIATADSVDAGDTGALRMLLNRALVTTLEDAGGDGIAIDASGNIAALLSANDGVDIGDVTVNNAAGAAAVNIQDGGNSITVDGSVTVSATDLDIRDLTLSQDAVKVSGNTSANSETNPIFVKNVVTVVSGSEIHDYDTAAAIAGDASSNHDYAVANATFMLKSVSFAASGGGKVELQVGPSASLVSKWVGFIPKTGGELTKRFDPPIEVPVAASGTVRLIRTNRQGAAQDLYSMIEGNDI